MGLAGFWGCVKILSETIGSLPLHTYRDLGNDEKEMATDRQEYGMLAHEFNPLMTSMVARGALQQHMACWGNAYALIRFNGAGKVDSLWPLKPWMTRPATTAGQLVYETTDTPSGKLVEYAPEDVFHIPYMSQDGIHGLSPIQIHRETIGLGIATERYGASFFGHGELPRGVLEHPATLTVDGRAQLKKDMEAIRVANNPHRTMILEEGMKYHVISVPPNDVQYIETRKLTISDMARIFRIPLAMLEQHDKSASYASVEQFFLQFAVHTIRPWLILWEQEIKRKIFGMKSELMAEFDIDDLQRGDIKTRYTAYHTAKTDGWMNGDEIRKRENMNKMPSGWGKAYFVPANMTTIDKAILGPPKQPTQQPKPGGDMQNPSQEQPPSPMPSKARTEHGPNGKEVAEAQ